MIRNTLLFHINLKIKSSYLIKIFILFALLKKLNSKYYGFFTIKKYIDLYVYNLSF